MFKSPYWIQKGRKVHLSLIGGSYLAATVSRCFVKLSVERGCVEQCECEMDTEKVSHFLIK